VEKEAFLRLPAPLREKIRTADPGEPEKLTTEDRLRLNGLEPSLRRKITTLLLQTVKEKEEKKPGSPLEGAVAEDQEPPGKVPTGEKPGDEQSSTDKEAVHPATIPKPAPLPRFGADLFAQRLADYLPELSLPVFDDYILGPGDQIVLHYWNILLDETLTLTVSRQGKIAIPRKGELAVWGVAFGRLGALLEAELSKYYKDVKLSVSMGKLRSIQVYVVGEVERPGLYTVSALSTIVGALLTTGGPTRAGSMRRIELRRKGKTVRTFDFYDFLLRGDRAGDIRLLGGDTLFVPVVGPLVEMAGELQRAAVYELRDEKTLADAIALAGGFTARSYRGSLQVERTVGGERREIIDVQGDFADFAVADGDRIRVGAVDRVVRNSVHMEGNVLRPGAYQWQPGMKVSDLLAMAGGVLPGTYLGRAEILRVVPAGQDLRVDVKGIAYRPRRRQLRVDLGAIIEKRPNADLALEKMDVLRVLSLAEITPRLTVRITGHVDNPGPYPFREGMTLTDLVFSAQRTLRPDTHLDRVEVLRLVAGSRGYAFAQGGSKTTARRVTLKVHLGRALEGGPEDLALHPFDNVILYAAIDVRPVLEVTVTGAVRNPQTCELTEAMRVSDLVFRAGGVSKVAYLAKAEIVRRVYRGGAESGEYTVKTIEFNLGGALGGDDKEDLHLENYDRVIIKRCSDYFVSVTVEGEVSFPGTYVMQKGYRLSDLIRRAGGFTQRAFLPGTFFTRHAVREIQEKTLQRFVAEQKSKVLQMETELSMKAVNDEVLRKIQSSIEARKRLLQELENTPVVGRLSIRLEKGEAFTSSIFNLELKDGDYLRIPEVPVSITLQGELFNTGSVLFIEGRRLEYYVNMAGGFREGADRERIYIIKADGSARPRSAGGGRHIRWDSENARWVRGRLGRVIERGDIIIVPPTSTVVSGYDLTKDIVDILFKIAMAAGVVVSLF
jgi:polysaccharide export outer membrane protein